MIDFAVFDRRPIVMAIAGPNGAGKTTFFHSHVASAGLRFVNADVLAFELATEPYAAARLADALRRTLVKRRESFIFETVFSDPVGEKIAFLEEAARCGYTVVLCFTGLSSPDQSRERVAMRVSQGGHDVPDEKLLSRFPGEVWQLICRRTLSSQGCTRRGIQPQPARLRITSLWERTLLSIFRVFRVFHGDHFRRCSIENHHDIHELHEKRALAELPH